MCARGPPPPIPTTSHALFPGDAPRHAWVPGTHPRCASAASTCKEHHTPFSEDGSEDHFSGSAFSHWFSTARLHMHAWSREARLPTAWVSKGTCARWTSSSQFITLLVPQHASLVRRFTDLYISSLAPLPPVPHRPTPNPHPPLHPGSLDSHYSPRTFTRRRRS